MLSDQSANTQKGWWAVPTILSAAVISTAIYGIYVLYILKHDCCSQAHSLGLTFHHHLDHISIVDNNEPPKLPAHNQPPEQNECLELVALPASPKPVYTGYH
ncbi:uncharacterized protein EV420DRAFT_1650399 [Desarmillaria tabescens]|uniref:Uncharacterized protein n=1 Tax=Armillaria tabescens TaxID=1929756 RepID=A0AA39JG05_ARMTA|nr:uncharacterized protein EV420DRAFT_1650399 [Desarmillaria tabescens]KAK0440649.1 hypothetical protein EV420DRAFT_1650399 [Desarmillaria tabescens]